MDEKVKIRVGWLKIVLDPKRRDLKLALTSVCFRDTPLRYLGYANEVGEAFRALMHVRY